MFRVWGLGFGVQGLGLGLAGGWARIVGTRGCARWTPFWEMVQSSSSSGSGFGLT